MDIKEIIQQGRPATQIITDLKRKAIIVPSWSELVKEFDPKQHPVFTDKSYKDRPKKGGKIEKMTRIGLALQKLATKRISELCFGIPVQRLYKPKNDNEKRAAAFMEAIFKKNHIDSVNIKRARKLYAGCEYATIWYAQDKPTTYAGEKSLLKIRCRTYSPKPESTRYSGDLLYPLFDEYDDMIALSIQSCRQDGTNVIHYFDTYTEDGHYRWLNKNSGWEPDTEIGPEGFEQLNIGKIPGVYQYRPEPIWEDQSENVFEAEWSLSRNGNYLRKNSRPTWVIFSDNRIQMGNESNDDRSGRNVVKYGKDDKAQYATWQQAIESLKFHIEEIKRDFFMTLQLPDMSMENMKATPMSGEARKMMFIDAQLKVTDEAGDWTESFDREINVVKEFAKVANPELAPYIDSLEVENKITPFTINDESEKIQNASNMAGGKAVASRKTAVRYLGKVSEDELDQEIADIEADEAAGMANIFEPSAE